MKKLGLLSAVLAGFVLTACSEGVMEPVGMFAPEGVAFHVASEGGTAHSDLAPTITAPDEGDVLDAGEISFQWSHGTDADRDSYRYKIECTGTGCTSVGETVIVGSGTSVGHSLAPGDYEFFIRGEKTSGSSPLHASDWVSVEFSVVDAPSVTWHLTGFYRPVNPDPTVLNRIRRNAAVPLKFNVFEDEEMEVEITDVDELAANFSVQPIICNGDTNDELEDFEVKGQTVLRYDTEGTQFVQNWQAPRNPGCYVVTLETAGGNLSAKFQVF